MTLEQLGAQAYGHYKAGEKNYAKAMEHAKSAGLYLIEARDRVTKSKEMTFAGFLKAHCPDIKKTRAYEFMSVAGGKTTVAEINDRKNASRSPAAAVRVRGRSLQITEQRQSSRLVFQAPPQEPSDDPRAALIERINAKLERLSIDQLHAVERLIPNVH
jgi:hypothetical protein